MALSQWLREGQLYDKNHYSMVCQEGRKGVTSNHWFNTTMPLIVCGIGFLEDMSQSTNDVPQYTTTPVLSKNQ